MGFANFFLKGKRSNSKKTNKVESSNTNTATYVCRDELDKKKPKIKKQVKFDLERKYQHQVLEEEISNDEEPKKCIREGVYDHDNVINNRGVKVKILMRKEDAARLLLKCSEGGILEFMDVAHELVSSSNVKVISSPIHNSCNYGSLKAIPE
ncbi:hypothetical protein H5410_043906 [Solanum commersonii]|uniref:DUF7890 domain-containing protein n=1 Tax=Solanum commersonii TaxID=4109 RepID=A0A9J5Y1J2_SOLCO|nr:hypothetical protein H5410_043906 [Solanum commersonii]